MDIKNRVSQVRAYLDGIGQSISSVQGYEVVARALGYKSKHVLAASATTPEALEPFEPLQVCLSASATAGYHSDDCADALSFTLTPEGWARILAARALCQTEGFDHVCLAVAPSSWTTTKTFSAEDGEEGEDDQLSMYWHGLHVDKDGFWFEGWAEDSDIDTVSDRLYFNQLPAPLGDGAGEFQTRVGTFLFGTDDPETVRYLAQRVAPQALPLLA